MVRHDQLAPLFDQGVVVARTGQPVAARHPLNSNGVPRQYLPKQTEPRRYGRDGGDLAAVKPT